MPCPRCGASNRAQARFCHDCGSSLGVAEQQTPVADTPPITQTALAATASAESEVPASPADRHADAGQSQELSFGPGRRGDGSSPLRRPAVAIPLSAAAVVAVLALVGWQAKWPTSVFGAKQAAAISRESPVRTGQATPESSYSATQTPLSPSPTATQTASPTASPTPAPNPAVATVDAYFAAINHRHYSTAWNLLGGDGGTSYAAFVKGFSGTIKDTVTILAVRGGVVTVRLSALHSNGEVQVFEGTYTVRNGVIVSSNIQQVS